MTAILGISGFYHDAAAALVVDGEIVAAAQEERFSRRKHDAAMPVRAVEWCLRRAGIEAAELDYVGFYEKPLAKLDRLLETHLAVAPRGFSGFAAAMPSWLADKLHLPARIRRGVPGYRGPILFCDHHESHAASAFYPSPFAEAAVLTIDGVGEWATASFGVGREHRLELTRALSFPHSLGLLYSALTYFTGFAVNADEYKVMGLAPYGEPTYLDLLLAEVVHLGEDGSLWLDQRYFDYCGGLTMTSSAMDQLLGGPPRRPDQPIGEREMNLAASVQRLTEEVLLRTAREVHRQTGQRRLCLAGGVALNCVANGRLQREGPFDEIWIQPAAGDAGGALGVALLVWHELLQNPRPAPRDAMRGALLGPEYTAEEILAALDAAGAHHRDFASDEGMLEQTVELLAEGKVVGWFQGRMEYGPRALGSRSILADPRLPEMQSLINRKVKFREGFRPFAPVVLAEHAAEVFALPPAVPSPYMLLVAPLREEQLLPLEPGDAAVRGLARRDVVRSRLPAVTHVDGSARIQTVAAESPELYRRLLERFHARTGCPVLVNTSFNLGWEPIVESPEQAVATFFASELDALVIGRVVVEKRQQPAWIEAPSASAPADGIADLLSSPCCRSALAPATDALACATCGQRFPRTDGVLQLYWPHDRAGSPGDVTETVQAFYEANPFPSYDDLETLRSLLDKARQGIYARALDLAIPPNSTVLDVGCGTGQLTNFLAIGCRRVVGADLCLPSLRLGEEFRARHGLSRARFVQMNLFRPALLPASFDVVLANGVLHHTSDPLGGLRSLAGLVRPGGHLVVGLYNTFGRLGVDLRRQLLRLGGERWARLDPYLRDGRLSAAKQRAWLADQYRHPHESKHTMGEILGWFEQLGLDFVRGVPSLGYWDDDLAATPLFAPGSRGSACSRALAQLRMIRSGNREGGFFLMIARRG
jgi:carbamoyltransferase